MLPTSVTHTHHHLRRAVMVLSLAMCPRSIEAFSYQNNYVNMPLQASGYTLLSASYTINDFSITAGQDPSGHISKGMTATYAGNNGSMLFVIGRQGSSSVASWFTSYITPAMDTFNSTPNDLNFGFMGTLTLKLTGGVLGTNSDTYTLNNIAIAQGNAGSVNNWWFGGTACTYTATSTVNCPGTSTAGYNVTFTFQRGGNAVNDIVLTSITYPPYTTFSLQSIYVGENTNCGWVKLLKSPVPCPPFVVYYNSTQSASMLLSVQGGKLYDSMGNLFDTTLGTPWHSGPVVAIFVMSTTGQIYASNVSVPGLFHHSSLLAGVPVASAGELTVTKGVIQTMTNCSGHYRPTPVAYAQLNEALHRQGYTASFTFNQCTFPVDEDPYSRIIRSRQTDD